MTEAIRKTKLDGDQKNLATELSFDKGAADSVAHLQNLLDTASRRKAATTKKDEHTSADERRALERRLCDPDDDSVFQADFARLAAVQMTVSNYRSARELGLW